MRIGNNFENDLPQTLFFMVVPCNLPTKISPKVSFGQNANTPMQNCNTIYIFCRSQLRCTHIYMKIPNNYERCVINSISLNGAPMSGGKFVKKNTKNNKKKKMCQQMQLWVVENCCWGPISAAGARHLPLGHSMRGGGRFLIFSKYFYLFF